MADVDNSAAKKKAKAQTMARYRAKKKATKKPVNGAHAPTKGSRQLVSELTGFGYPQTDIANFLGITVVTLTKHYRFELDNGTMNINVKVQRSAFNKAKSKDPRNNAIMLHWLKTRCGWVEDKGADVVDQLAAILESRVVMTEAEWSAKHGKAQS